MTLKLSDFDSEPEYRDWLISALRAQATFVPESRIGDTLLEAADYVELLQARENVQPEEGE